jgi:undecaprenyl-diphosphatase
MGMKRNRPWSWGNVISKETVLWTGALIGACVGLTIMLQFKEITDIDLWLFAEVREQYETGLKSFVRVFTDIGAPYVWFVGVPLLWTIRRRKEAVAVLLAILIVIVISWAMKYGIDRPRPFDLIQAIDPVYRPIDPSFPSAHAMTVFAVAIAIGLKWRRALIPLLTLAAAVGYSRVYIGVHFPYDVASGALIGILIGLVVNSLDLSGIIRWIDIRIMSIGNRVRTSVSPDEPVSEHSQDKIGNH